MHFSAVQCSASQCSAVQCSAVQCSVVQCIAVQCSAVQCRAVQLNRCISHKKAAVMHSIHSSCAGWCNSPKVLHCTVQHFCSTLLFNTTELGSFEQISAKQCRAVVKRAVYVSVQVDHGGIGALHHQPQSSSLVTDLRYNWTDRKYSRTV